MIRTLSIVSIAIFATLAVSAQAPATQPTPEQLTGRQVKVLVATASTPADHERIAHYYEAKALEYRTEAEKHDAMLTAFQANPVMYSDKERPGTIDHCAYLAKSLKQRAVKAEALARQHEQMAHATQSK
jgi:hypothetical protein